jgi:alpha-N-arabinofuranosidase
MVSGSASLKGQILFLTLTNVNATDAVDVTVELLGGAAAQSGTARVLTGEIHAHNTFDAPETVALQPFAIDASGSTFTVTLPPAAVFAAGIKLS